MGGQGEYRGRGKGWEEERGEIVTVMYAMYAFGELAVSFW